MPNFAKKFAYEMGESFIIHKNYYKILEKERFYEKLCVIWFNKAL